MNLILNFYLYCTHVLNFFWIFNKFNNKKNITDEDFTNKNNKPNFKIKINKKYKNKTKKYNHIFPNIITVPDSKFLEDSEPIVF